MGDSTGIVPRILSLQLGTRWRWVLRFRPRLFCVRRTEREYLSSYRVQLVSGFT